MVKTQFKKVIKKWHIDGGKEYSLKKLAELTDNLKQIVKFTTPYNLEQDGTFKQVIGILCKHTQTVIININIPQFF